MERQASVDVHLFMLSDKLITEDRATTRTSKHKRSHEGETP